MSLRKSNPERARPLVTQNQAASQIFQAYLKRSHHNHNNNHQQQDRRNFIHNSVSFSRKMILAPFEARLLLSQPKMK